MKSLLLLPIPLLSLSIVSSLLTSAIANPVVDKITNTTPLLMAQNINCSVVNIRTGQLALRFSPNGKSRAGLDNGNTLELLRGGSGDWRYIRVLDSPNYRINSLEGWVNSNYLACSGAGVDDSGDFMSVRVFDPPSNMPYLAVTFLAN